MVGQCQLVLAKPRADGDLSRSTTVRRHSREPWADLCRIVAIYGVVLIHSCAATFYGFVQVPRTDWLSANAIDSLARVSVPLFVMISGAMLLRPNAPSVRSLAVLARVGKVALPLVTWSAFYLYRHSLHTGVPIDWWSLFRQPAMYHLWFVYMIAGIYVLLPFLKAIHDQLLGRTAAILYFFAVWAAITSVPVYLPLPFLSVMQQTSFLGYGGFFIIGGLIANSRRTRGRVPAIAFLTLYLAASAVTFALTWHFSLLTEAPSERAYVYFAPNVVIASVAAFAAVTSLSIKERAGKFLEWIADRTFLVFFVHVWVLEHVRYSEVARTLTRSAPEVVGIVFVATVTFALSLVIATLIRLIPGTRHVAG